MRAAAVVLFCAIAGAACGGDPIVRIPSRTTPAGPNQPAYTDDEVSIDGVAWGEMGREQRAKFMADVVMPTMRTLFVAQDPATYQRGFGCATCHGNNATEVNFAMPNGLAPLDPDALPSPASEDAHVADWASFMITEVTPRMAELLGEGELGCFACHARKK